MLILCPQSIAAFFLCLEQTGCMPFIFKLLQLSAVLYPAYSALVAQPCLQSNSNCVENNPVSVDRSRVVTAENGIPISTLHSNHSKCRTPTTTHHPPAARRWTLVTIYGWISLYPTFQSTTRQMSRRQMFAVMLPGVTISVWRDTG